MTSSSRQSAGPTPFRRPDPAAEREFAERVGIQFDDPLLLRLALTHRSVLHDWTSVRGIDAIMQSNERLEFLGDALLGAIVAEHLYHADPDADEGTLTRQRVAIVRAETLVRWARELRMDECLYLGTGERTSSSARDRMLAGAFEALVGAISLDQGRDIAEQFVLRFLHRDIESILDTEHEANPKGTLQEVLQDLYRVAPTYETLLAEGPDHARSFTVAVLRDGEQLGVGQGRSKREAQQEAAREALALLRQRNRKNSTPATTSAPGVDTEPK